MWSTAGFYTRSPAILIFVNDLPLVIGNKVHSVDLYADDTTVYDIQCNKQVLESNLQSASSSLENWCLKNGMRLNIDKTKVMFFTTNQKRRYLDNDKLSISYNDCTLSQSSSEKLLGVYFQDDFRWDSHIRYVSKKLNSILWLLSRIKDFLNLDYKIRYYKAYMQPHMDYCSMIWGSTLLKTAKYTGYKIQCIS